MQKECKTIEYKQTMSKTYLKTVSAFANYNDGQIIFGITDDYKIKGIEDPVKMCLSIETQINDSIKPQVDYSLRITEDNTIILSVSKGEHTPYLYDNKAYKRNDSATIEVDELELKRLMLEGLNLTFEQIKSSKQDLKFETLKSLLVEKLNLSKFDLDTLKSLDLYNDKNGFNNAAYILSDDNNFPGIDIVLFGENINIFKKRYTLGNESLLKQYYDAIEIFKDNYIYEKIEFGERSKLEKVPFNAFREALANALIHRAFDVNANIKIEMYEDKIVISSPGGLTSGISKDAYLDGSLSILRNRIIANVFHRLDIVEIFATGITRIKKSYDDFLTKPEFSVKEDSISVILPAIAEISLSESEKSILSCMNLNYDYKRNDIEDATGLSKYTVIRILNNLEKKHIIIKKGNGPSVLYSRIK